MAIENPNKDLDSIERLVKSGAFPEACLHMAKELRDLRWFRDEINKNVLPGETDTQGSAFELLTRYRLALEKIESGQGLPIGGSDRCDSYPALIRRAEEALRGSHDNL